MKRIQSLLSVLVSILIMGFLIINMLLIASIVNLERNKHSAAGIWNLSFIEAKDESLLSSAKSGDLIVLHNPGLDNLKYGDVITYSEGGNKFTTRKIAEVKERTYLTVDNEGVETLAVTADRVIGKYVLSIPYGGYIIEFAKTKIGFAICVTIPCFIVLTYLLSVLTDLVRNSSKHRKRILRKRKRRKSRYLKEGLYVDKKAVI